MPEICGTKKARDVSYGHAVDGEDESNEWLSQ